MRRFLAVISVLMLLLVGFSLYMDYWRVSHGLPLRSMDIGLDAVLFLLWLSVYMNYRRER